MVSTRVRFLLSLAVVTLFGLEPGALQGLRVNAPLIPDGDVSPFFALSPDSRFTVFVADGDRDEVHELYSVRLGPPFERIKLNDEFLPGHEVQALSTALSISPDSRRVLFLADADFNNVYALYSVPIDGSESPLKLNGTLPFGVSVEAGFLIAPDSSRVVYQAGRKVFSVPLEGGVAVQLNGPLPAGAHVDSFGISSDSARVVYVADEDVSGVHEIFSVPINGSSAPVRLNGPLVAGGDVIPQVDISSDSSRVVYVADEDVDEIRELFSVPIDGSSAPVQLNGPLVAGGTVISGFLSISSDSSRVVYSADEVTNEVFELFSVPLDGGAAPVRLNGSLVAGGDVDYPSVWLAPDASRVVYRADEHTNDRLELFSAPIDGSSPSVKLHPSLLFGQSVGQVRITPDSSRVVYVSNAIQSFKNELFSVPIDASSAPVKLNPTPVFNGDVLDFAIDPKGRSVLYKGNVLDADLFELFSAPIDGSSPSRRVNRHLPAGGGTWNYVFTADGRRALYTGKQDDPDRMELYLSYLTPIYRRAP